MKLPTCCECLTLTVEEMPDGGCHSCTELKAERFDKAVEWLEKRGPSQYKAELLRILRGES